MLTFGIGVAVALQQQFVEWIKADWTHGTTVGLLLFSACALLALNATEKELEAKQYIHPEMANLKVQFRPILHFNEGDKYNILVVSFDVLFSNPTATLTRTIFPVLELLHRRKKGWRILAAELDRQSLNTIVTYRSVYESRRDYWYPGKSTNIRPLDETIAQFQIMWMVPDESLELLDGELAIRLTGKIMGHPRPVVLLQRLPRVDKTEFASRPSADPAPSTPSG